MIVPTIGRVVLVHREDLSDQRCPAFVTYVHSSNCINVAGFSGTGNPFAVASIELLQDDEVPKNPNLFAEWMPYQKMVAGRENPPTSDATQG